MSKIIGLNITGLKKEIVDNNLIFKANLFLKKNKIGTIEANLENNKINYSLREDIDTEKIEKIIKEKCQELHNDVSEEYNLCSLIKDLVVLKEIEREFTKKRREGFQTLVIIRLNGEIKDYMVFKELCIDSEEFMEKYDDEILKPYYKLDDIKNYYYIIATSSDEIAEGDDIFLEDIKINN